MLEAFDMTWLVHGTNGTQHTHDPGRCPRQTRDDMEPRKRGITTDNLLTSPLLPVMAKEVAA